MLLRKLLFQSESESESESVKKLLFQEESESESESVKKLLFQEESESGFNEFLFLTYCVLLNFSQVYKVRDFRCRSKKPNCLTFKIT